MATVLPIGNADWDVIDAPVPALQTWADGADVDISTLESEMDTIQQVIDEMEETGLFGEDSVYIGSARYSFMRAQNKVTLRTLKLDHIPKYLGDQGYHSGPSVR